MTQVFEHEAETPMSSQGAREMALRFLQTVVVVDDEAHLPRLNVADPAQRRIATDEDRVRAGFEPPAPTAPTAVRRNRPDRVLVPPGGAQPEVPTAGLDAQRLIEAFAGNGLVCAVLRPESKAPNPVLDQTVAAARRADVLIVDWQIFQDDGESAMYVIEEVLRSDNESSQRLRLIVVYTALATADIRNQIKNRLGARFGPAFANEGANVLVAAATRILLLQKPGGLAPALGTEEVPTSELPGRVADEFAKMTRGLIPGIATASLAALRENSHRLLSKLHAGLDAPYLAHRAMLPSPEDAEDHLIALVVGELQSILRQADVRDSADAGAIVEWLTANKGRLPLHTLYAGNHNGSLPAGTEMPPSFREDMRTLFDVGYNGENQSSLPAALRRLGKEPHKKIGAHTFHPDRLEGEHLDCELAMLTATQSRYTRSIPFLQLGVVLGRLEAGSVSFWLCLQPRCDSVRIERKPMPEVGDTHADAATRKFLLSRCLKTDKSQPHDIVIRGLDGRFVHLKVSMKVQDSELEEFAADPNTKTVLPVVTGDGRTVFNSVGRGYWMVAELKPEYAQDVANRYGAAVARVALDRTEWLRRYGNSD